MDEELRNLIYSLQQQYWPQHPNMTSDRVFQLVAELKENLQRIRLGVKEEVRNVASGGAKDFFKPTEEELDDKCLDAFVTTMRTISTRCSEHMINFTRKVMEKSLSIMADICPCPFAVVAIGSLSRGEATPYSDLEYLFLIKDNRSRNLKFFERLAITSYFLIGNLGETKLSYMDIEELRGWFDDCSINGFKIDGLTEDAGNIPTGNGQGSTNPFIVTPQEMIARYKTLMVQPDHKRALRGDLTAMLAYMRCVYSEGDGEQMLSDLKSKMREIKADYHRTVLNVQMLENDVKKYNLEQHSDLSNKGYTLNVKKELYRFPSILLLDLAVIYDCAGESTWKTIGNLFRNKNISKQICTSLNFLLSCACYIRLSAYFFHGSHDDRVSVALKTSSEVESETSPSTKQQRRWFIPNKLFTVFYEHLLPLKQMLTEPPNFKEALAMTDKFDNQWLIKAQNHHFVGKHNKSLSLLNEKLGFLAQVEPQKAVTELRKIGQPLSWDVIILISEVLLKCHEYTAALHFFKYLEERYIGTFLIQIVKCYTNTGQHREALHVLQGIQATRDRTDPEINYAFGRLYFKEKKWRLAQRHFVDALNEYHRQASQEVLFDYYGLRVKASPAQVTNSELTGYIMMTHRGHLDVAKISYVSSDIINCVLYLGRILSKRGVLKEVPTYFFKCKNMISMLYGSDALVPIQATVLKRIGESFSRMNLHKDAMQYYKESHRMHLLIHGYDAINSGMALILYKQAKCLDSQGQKRAAYDVMKQANDMYRKVNPNHPKLRKCQIFLIRYKAIIPITIMVLILLLALLSFIIYTAVFM